MTKIRMFACAMLVAVAGCAVGEEEMVGSVEVPLTAVSDGVTYRLTEGAVLALQAPGFYDEVSLDGDQTVQRINLPPGEYQARLLYIGAELSQWPLARTAGGQTEDVWGTLVTPMPATLTIVRAEVTEFTLEFQVPRAKNVTFGRGHLDVSVAFEEVDATGAQIQTTGSYDRPAQVTVGASLPPAAVAQLPANGDTNVGLGIGLVLTGPWQQQSLGSVCAPAGWASHGWIQAGVGDLIVESAVAPESSISVCIYARDTDTLVILSATRFGAAMTDTFQGLGGSNLIFSTILLFELPAGIFDGETLDVEALADGHIAHGEVLMRAAVMEGEVFYDASFSGDQAFIKLLPRL